MGFNKDETLHINKTRSDERTVSEAITGCKMYKDDFYGNNEENLRYTNPEAARKTGMKMATLNSYLRRLKMAYITGFEFQTNATMGDVDRHNAKYVHEDLMKTSKKSKKIQKPEKKEIVQ